MSRVNNICTTWYQKPLLECSLRGRVLKNISGNILYTYIFILLRA